METESVHRFSTLCRLCEKVAKSPLKNKRLLIKKYIDAWRSSPIYTETDLNRSFFPALRLLCPSLDKGRVFGFKEIRLGQEFVKILCLSKDCSDSKSLTSHRENHADFSEVVYSVMKSRGGIEKSTLDVETVNNFLDKIASGFLNSDREQVSNSLKYLVTNLSALENKWLVRFLIKNTRFGLSDVSILGEFHPQAKQHYEIHQDLKQICVELKDFESRSPRKLIQLFKPFAPMLAERINLVDYVPNSDSNFFIETKFDGERMILHKRNNELQYFSRSGHNYSQSLNSTLTPFIASSFPPDIVECILDGEILIYNEKNDTFATKNTSNTDVKKMSHENLDVEHPIYMVFDVLLINEQVLLEEPLFKRKQILQDRFVSSPKYFQIVQHRSISAKAEAIKALNIAVENREEGIMLKEHDSVYKINTRRKSGWYKLKPEYVVGLVDDIDLVIIGGYFGEGRRQGIISHFLLAASAEDRFYSFVRVGSGYSDNQLTELLAKLQKHWIMRQSCQFIDSVDFHKSKPDLIIDPKNSVVLQIKGSEFTESDEFKTGFSLRFPRVVRIRDDKKYTDCTTVEELRDLRSRGSGVLNTKRLQEDSDDESFSKKRKTNVVRTLAPYFRIADTEHVSVECDIFGGREICVVNGSDLIAKPKIEALIKKFNGTLAANPSENTYCLLADSLKELKIKNLIQSGNYDVLKITWFVKCIKSKGFAHPHPNDYWFITNATKIRISRFFDAFADSFTENVNCIGMKNILKQAVNCKRVNDTELLELESCVWNEREAALGLLRAMNFFVYRSSFQSYSKISEAKVVFYGGTLVNSFSEATHVLVDSNDETALYECESIKNQDSLSFEIIDYSCLENFISSICKKSKNKINH